MPFICRPKLPGGFLRIASALAFLIAGANAGAELPPAVVTLFDFTGTQGFILNGPEFLGLGKDYGAVRKGKMADLLLLDADPLQNIRATQQIAGVIKQGFDQLGRVVLTSQPQSIKTRLTLPAEGGMYIIKAILSTGQQGVIKVIR